MLSSDGAEITTWTAPANSGLPNPFPAAVNGLFLFTTEARQCWALVAGPGAADWFDQPVALNSGQSGGADDLNLYMPVILKNTAS